MTVIFPKVNEKKEEKSITVATGCAVDPLFSEVATAKHVAQMQQVGLRKDVLQTPSLSLEKLAAKVPVKFSHVSCEVSSQTVQHVLGKTMEKHGKTFEKHGKKTFFVVCRLFLDLRSAVDGRSLIRYSWIGDDQPLKKHQVNMVAPCGP